VILATADKGELRVTSISKKGLLEDWPWSGSAPSSDWLMAGNLISADQAVGLPALLAALLMLADSISMLPTIVYRGAGSDERDRAPDTWQWDLFHRRPNAETTPGAFRADIVLSLAAGGNAFIRKWKSGGRVRQLEVLDRRFVRARRSGGRVVFDDYTYTGKPGDATTRDATDIIHLRLGRLNASSNLVYSPEGISPVSAARVAIATGLKRQRFEAGYYDRDAKPGVVLTFPQNVDEEQARAFIDLWDAEHAGVDRAHSTAAVGGGATVTQIPINLHDAQFVEANRLTMSQMAGIYRIPKEFLDADTGARPASSPDVARNRLVTFALGPYLTIMDEGFSADPDLCPPGEHLYVEHLSDALLRPDTQARYEAYKNARQAGWLTANEIRRLEGYKPDPRGDELQATPVGGAPNDSGGGGGKSREVIVIPAGGYKSQDGDDAIAAAIAEGLKAIAEREPLELRAVLEVPNRQVVVKRADGTETLYSEEESS
jgi:HK97 family phage portal protein